MRLLYDPQTRLDCPRVEEVKLNLKCRDEIVPVLRALQHLYGQPALRRELLEVVGKDINGTSSRKVGRPGLGYWQITVLAGVRLGCNLNYDKLQDLAEQHRNLRLIMGVGDWDDHVDFDWRRIQDNVTLLRPETLTKLNRLIVAAGHELLPEAVQAVRGDSFVVETNIHYPTESSLIGDGLRKVVKLASALAKDYELGGWRQHKNQLQSVRKLVRKIGRISRSKGKDSIKRLRRGYQELLDLAKDLLKRAGQLLARLALRVESTRADLALPARTKELQHYRSLTEQVCATATRRVLRGETVANEDKLFSIFEPHTELINRGKQPHPIQYGHKVLVIEDAAGFICHYEVMGKGVLDQDVVVTVMRSLQKRMGGKIELASFDRAFHTPQNQVALAEIVSHPCIAAKGETQGRKQYVNGSVAFRQGRQNHPGVESTIGALQCGNGLERCRDKSERGYQRYVGVGILGRNLHVLGKLLLVQDDANCQAAQSKRKRCPA
jgi:transposase, IS5 family